MGERWHERQDYQGEGVTNNLHTSAYGNLDLLQILRIAEGVAYLHTREPPVIHSNLRMVWTSLSKRRRSVLTTGSFQENILLDSNNDILITDIGIYKFLHDHQLSTYGRPEDVRRVAPELWLGGTFTVASDTYTFGCLALGMSHATRMSMSSSSNPTEILTGRSLYSKITHDAEVVLAVQRGESFSLEDYPELAGKTSLWTMLEALWDRNPERRITMRQVVLELENCAKGIGFSSPTIEQVGFSRNYYSEITSRLLTAPMLSNCNHPSISEYGTPYMQSFLQAL